MGFFRGVEHTDMYSLMVAFDNGSVSVFLLVKPNTLQLRLAVAHYRSVDAVLRVRGKPQIFNSVVCLVAINVIQHLRRPNAMLKKPNQPMSQNVFFEHTHVDVPVSFLTAHNFTNPVLVICFFSVEDPIFCIVLKEYFNFLF